MDNTQEHSFEDAFNALEDIIAKLESGDVSLEESVDLFEQGRKLATYCQDILDKAELRVKQITDDGDITPLE